MTVANTKNLANFQQQFQGRFNGVMRWPELDALWGRVLAQPEGWYVYHVGQPVPDEVVDVDLLDRFIEKLDGLLHQEHDEDYCGIVYADSLETPTMIKVYDPNNLGVVCGPGTEPVPPGWLLSRIPPEDISLDAIMLANRRRWWQRIFA